jgi:hypothetical protein
MSTKLRAFLYTVGPLVMIFVEWIIYVIVSHNLTSSDHTTRILYLLINCLSFTLQGLAIAGCIKLKHEDFLNLHMILSACLGIFLFMVFFNITAVNITYLPETVVDFIADESYLGFIWAGAYFYNLIVDLVF